MYNFKFCRESQEMNTAANAKTVRNSKEMPYCQYIRSVEGVTKLEGHSKFLMSRLGSHDRVTRQHSGWHYSTGRLLSCYVDDLISLQLADVTLEPLEEKSSPLNRTEHSIVD